MIYESPDAPVRAGVTDPGEFTGINPLIVPLAKLDAVRAEVGAGLFDEWVERGLIVVDRYRHYI